MPHKQSRRRKLQEEKASRNVTPCMVILLFWYFHIKVIAVDHRIVVT